MELVHEMTYRITGMRGPLAPTDGSPLGARQYFEMSSATLSGPRISATLALPGGDWMLRGGDGFWRPDVRVQFVTDDGAVVLLHYTGLVEQTPAFTAAAEQNRPTDWADHYLRMSMRFDVGSPDYAWLNRSLFVARGRLLGTTELEYEVYRVT